MVLKRLAFATVMLLAVSDESLGQTLSHLWSFDGDFTDASGNGNDGTAVGAPAFVSGKYGQAASFTATPDGGVTPGDGVENSFASGLPSLGTDSWTMNLWASFSEAPTALEYLAGFGVGDDYVDGDAGRARGILNFGSGFYFWGANADVDAGIGYDADSQWHMFTVVHDATSSTISMYKDATFVTSATLGAPLQDTFDQVQAGNPSLWNNDFNGSLDEFAIFTGTLSPEQIGGLYLLNDFTQPVKLDPTLTVDRDTGEITLTNDSSFDIDLLGYTVRSSAGAIDPSQWDTVAGRFDVPPGGDGSVDANDAWTVITNTANQFSVEFSEGVPGTDGGTIEIGKVISFGSDAWIGNPVEDIVIDLLLNDGQGTIHSVVATFVGNGDQSFAAGDLDADGDIDVDDFGLLRDAANADTSGLLPVEAYLGGDFNGDGRKNLTDYAIFKGWFEAANGSGSFASVTSQVPEPAVLTMLLPLGLMMFAWRRRFAPAAVLSALAIFVTATSDAHAQLHGYYQLNGNANESTGNNTNLNLVGGALFGESLHPGLGTAFSGDGIDDAAIGENFVRVTGNDLSVVAWVYAESNDQNTWESIVKNWGEALPGQFHFGLGPDAANTLNNFYSTAAGGAFPNDASAETLPTGEWVHTAFVLDSAAGQHRLYVNGSVVATGVYGGSLLQPGDAGFATGLGIGGKPNDDGTAAAAGFGFWNGRIDEVGIYSTALADGDIAQIMADAQQGIQLDGTTVPYLEVVVKRDTGEVLLQNNTTGAVDLSGFELVSLAGNLSSGAFDPLAGDVGFPAGTGVGDGWESDGANDATQIIEGYFGGNSTFAPGETSVGFVYAGTSLGDEDLTFRFATPDGIVGSFVHYVNDYSTMQGDFNGDGVVNIADYTVWRNNLGAATEEAINGAGDGLNGVDVQDYLAWKTAFGSGAAAVVGQSQVAVPEPTGLAVVTGLLVVAGWQRSRRPLGRTSMQAE